jgi:hypothetical protein
VGAPIWKKTESAPVALILLRSGHPVATEAEARSRIVGTAGTNVQLQVLIPSLANSTCMTSLAQLFSDGNSRSVSITRIPYAKPSPPAPSYRLLIPATLTTALVFQP